jgi:hypothetical protein
VSSHSADRVAPYAGQVDWDSLSEPARWTLRHVAVPMLEGDDYPEVTEATGLSRREIDERLVTLKEELSAQASGANTQGSRVVYTRDLFDVHLEASDFELARWRIEARRQQMDLNFWLRQLANEAVS